MQRWCKFNLAAHCYSSSDECKKIPLHVTHWTFNLLMCTHLEAQQKCETCQRARTAILDWRMKCANSLGIQKKLCRQNTFDYAKFRLVRSCLTSTYFILYYLYFWNARNEVCPASDGRAQRSNANCTFERKNMIYRGEVDPRDTCQEKVWKVLRLNLQRRGTKESSHWKY